MSSIVFEKRNINADRVCDGISRIGYRPHAAVADIVDNSVAAHASQIEIIIELNEETTLYEKNNIKTITVCDNGCGMDDQGVRTALDLGSLVTYEEHSLSKYGLGLKSAGLSLGDRVVVLSKRNGILTKQYALDREAIRQHQAYGVCVVEPEKNLADLLESVESGTVVQVQKTHSPQDSAGTVRKNLSERLGVIYHGFLNRGNDPLVIRIRCATLEEEIEGFDIMFAEESESGFDPDAYDGKTPRLVVESNLTLYDSDNEQRVVPIKVAIFPKGEMQKHLGFSEDERNLIKTYRVSRKNSGFFVYRNGRLIRWGDNLGIVTKDHIGIRGRIDITTEHDDLLHVDVSKQNLELSEEFLEALKLKCRIPLSQMKEAFSLCDEIREGGSEVEGTAASQTIDGLREEDPDPIKNQTDQDERKRRRKIAQKQSVEKIQNDGERTRPDEITTFAKVRYTDKMKSTNLWSAENDAIHHTYVRINQNHQYYNLVLGRLSEGSHARIAIEGLLYALAVGENLTIENLSDVEFQEIRKVLDKLRRVISYNLENWAAHNQDLLE